jgi:ketosteroid isomerase-like protein
MCALLIYAAAASAALQAAPAAAAPSAPPPTAAAAAAAAVKADPQTVEQIRRLEHEWGQAFVKRDYALIERVVAPEYRLTGINPDGGVAVTHRAEWMRNTRAFEIQAFAAEVVDLATAGDTAVAVVKGEWTVKRRPDSPAQTLRFVVTDTWVRRGGRWQIISRHSHRLPAAPPPAVTR